MKTWKKILLGCTIVLVLCLLLLAALLHFTRPRFACESVKEQDRFEARFIGWTGRVEHTLQLNAGDELKVNWHGLKGGYIDLVIAMPGEKAVYTANRVYAGSQPRASFKVTVPQSGEYRIDLQVMMCSGELKVEKAP